MQPLDGRLLNAYYRVVVPTNGTTSAIYISPAVHSRLYRSRIVSFASNTTSISSGNKLSFTGRLERQSGRKWLSYPGQRIYLLVRVRGQRQWQGYVVYAKTNSSGDFTAAFTAGSAVKRFVFAALFDGSSKYLWSISSQITVAFNGAATRDPLLARDRGRSDAVRVATLAGVAQQGSWRLPSWIRTEVSERGPSAS